MGVYAMNNCTCYVHGYDVSGDANKLTLGITADELDSTTFGSGGSKARIGGLKDVTLNLDGYAQFAASSIDAEGFPDLGSVDRVATLTPTGTAGDVAYIAQLGKFKYSTFGQVGQIVPFHLDAAGTNAQGAIRGQLAKAKGAVSATGALGSALNLGAPVTGQYVYAALHVFTAATTITVQVQSDDNSGMSSPVTRGTIGPITVAGGTWLTRVAGPFAGETWWRMNVSAITGSFTVAGSIGIQ